MLRPRIAKLPWVGPWEATCTFGRNFTNSSIVLTLRFSSVSVVRACTVIGTFWMFSLRRCAVTTTSSNVRTASDCATACWACEDATAAKTAAEIFLFKMYPSGNTACIRCFG